MKAVVYERYGGPENLRLAEVEKPVPKDDEVLVRVYAVSINDWDWGLLTGTPFANRTINGLLRPKNSRILGSDIAGKVEAVGKNITGFKIGEEVFGDLCENGWGGFAEYVTAREDALELKPSNLSFEEAAAVPQAGLLAFQGLHYKGTDIQPGQKVLINGASGGVGPFAVQLARLAGAEVTGVCREDKMEFVRSLGVEHVIDYTAEDFTRNTTQYDVILDVKGFHPLLDYCRVLAPGGTYAMLGGGGKSILQVLFGAPLISLFGNKTMGLMFYKANKGLADMKQLLETGQVAPVIDRSFSLAEAAEAMRYYGEGRAQGKVLITVVKEA